MSILSIFDKFDHNNKIHNHIDNILHNFSSFFFNDLLLLYFTITVTVIIMKIVKLIYIYIIIRY